MTDFLHLQISEDAWLTACAACHQVLGFSHDADSLSAAEDAHRCPRDPDPKEEDSAAA